MSDDVVVVVISVIALVVLEVGKNDDVAELLQFLGALPCTGCSSNSVTWK